MPLKLGLVVLEDSKGRINIDVPAEGQVDDPNFRYSKLVWKVILNVLVKAASSPYNALANSLQVDEEQFRYIRFEDFQHSLKPEQTQQLDFIRELLKQKPQLSAKATLSLNLEKEKKRLQSHLAKRGFYLQKKYGSDTLLQPLTAVEEIKVEEQEASKDFTSFLEKRTNTPPGSLSDNELIERYVNDSVLQKEQDMLNNLRIQSLHNYLTNYPEIETQFRIDSAWVDDPARNRPRIEIQYDIKDLDE